MYISWNIPWCIRSEKKTNTNWFLLSPEALSNYKFKTDGSGFIRTCSVALEGKDDVHFSAPANKAANNGVVLLP